MPVTQISRIQVRRGAKDNLPQALAEGEIAMTTDTGEVFIGAPNLQRINYRGGSIFPYQNVRLITEFDLIHTMHDHVVTTGPLTRITATQRADDTNSYRFAYMGDPDNFPGGRVIPLSWSGNGPEPGDLRGRVMSKATLIRGVDGNSQAVPYKGITVKHKASQFTPNSTILVDLDDLGLAGFNMADEYIVTFLNLDEVVRYPLAQSNSFVMDYSLKSDEMINNLHVRRTGTLHITADQYSVAIMDLGVDLNQDTNTDNFMRIVWSGHIETIGVEDWVVLTCTNVSYYPVSITFAGSRWAHNEEVF